MEKELKILKKIIGKTVSHIRIDGNSILLPSREEVFGDCFDIILTSKEVVKITTEDAPHFCGEGDLKIDFEKDDSKEKSIISQNPKYVITNIETYIWSNKNLPFISGRKFLVQLDLYNLEDLILSVGFFCKNNNKVECLITGELCTSFKDLNLIEFSKRISKKSIS